MSDYKLDSATKEEWMERAMKAEDKLNTQLFKELSKPKMTKLEELKAEKDAAHVAYVAYQEELEKQEAANDLASIKCL